MQNTASLVIRSRNKRTQWPDQKPLHCSWPFAVAYCSRAATVAEQRSSRNTSNGNKSLLPRIITVRFCRLPNRWLVSVEGHRCIDCAYKATIQNAKVPFYVIGGGGLQAIVKVRVFQQTSNRWSLLALKRLLIIVRNITRKCRIHSMWTYGGATEM